MSPREEGSAALLVVLGATLLSVLGLAAIVAATDLAGATARASAAADAAALAAAARSPLVGGEGDPRDAAERLSQANGAELTAIDEGAWPREVSVTTGVAPRVRLVDVVLGVVAVEATAAVVPGAPIPAGELAEHAPPRHAGPGGGDGALSWPVRGTVTSPFGWRVHPVHGDRRFHQGLDVGAPHGTPIRAAGDGVVVAAGRRGGYGLLVDIAHHDGRVTRYAHASSLAVAVGAEVRAGQVLGAVGATGTATGPHLHFEVHEGGRPVDPRTRLPRRARVGGVRLGGGGRGRYAARPEEATRAAGRPRPVA